MIAKIVGGAVVVAASSKLGFDTAKKYSARVNTLRQFISGLWLLKSEIDYTREFAADAFKKVSLLVDNPVREVFAKCGERLTFNKSETFGKCFFDSLNEKNDQLNLLAEDKQILQSFADTFGTNASEIEIENINYTIKRLQECERRASENEVKYSKMFKVLGITCGLIIVIALI